MTNDSQGVKNNSTNVELELSIREKKLVAREKVLEDKEKKLKSIEYVPPAYEEDYIIVEELIEEIGLLEEAYLAEPTANRPIHAFDNYHKKLIYLKDVLRTQIICVNVISENVDSLLSLPEGTSDNVRAVIALNDEASSDKNKNVEQAPYKKFLEGLFASSSFTKSMGDHGIKMSSFSPYAIKQIINIVNRNTIGGRTGKN
jgi:hypothetical protein